MLFFALIKILSDTFFVGEQDFLNQYFKPLLKYNTYKSSH